MEARLRKRAIDVLREVAARHDMSMERIMGGSRKREDAWPRQEAMYEVFMQCPHLSFPQIGRIMGGRDHTTILHGVRSHCERTGRNYQWMRFVSGRAVPHTRKSCGPFAEAASVYGGVMKEALCAA